jgi:hypothetical protein
MGTNASGSDYIADREEFVMPRKRKSTRTVAGPKCPICNGFMKLGTVIPAAHIFPELKTYQCVGCGNRRTVEDEAELCLPETAQVAA